MAGKKKTPAKKKVAKEVTSRSKGTPKKIAAAGHGVKSTPRKRPTKRT